LDEVKKFVKKVSKLIYHKGQEIRFCSKIKDSSDLEMAVIKLAKEARQLLGRSLNGNQRIKN